MGEVWFIPTRASRVAEMVNTPDAVIQPSAEKGNLRYSLAKCERSLQPT